MIKQLLLAIDQLINVLVWLPGDGFGHADESLSARAWRVRDRVGLYRWIDRLWLWQQDHCRKSFNAEKARKHLPPEYRAA